MGRRFVRLCEIPSITEAEREMADAVTEELRGMGLEVSEDDRAAAARAGAGNLLCRIPGASEGSVMFCAHLDTVPHAGLIEVVEEGGVYRSRGETILGADNKAAVTVLMEMAARYAEAAPPALGVELLFTVAEEQGLRGAHVFDLEQLASPYGFVLDHASPIGEIITAAPTHKGLRAEFTGLESHAGMQPEEGRSAIAAAAAAVGAMELGRLDEATTANVGVISGGSSNNVVPGSCVVTGEARSVEAGRAEAVTMAMIEACQWAAGEHRCDVDVEVDDHFRGYRVKPSSPALPVARAAMERVGVAPVERATGGGSDANAFRARGYEALLLANGTVGPHTNDESVAAADLERMLEICLTVVEEAAS
jgi:tripeptide aminopeptidase